MAEKNKKPDPMPSHDTTPEEIGEFWDTHSLADYLNETHEVEFEVNLKSQQAKTHVEGKPLEHKQEIIVSDETKPDLPVTINDIKENGIGIINNLLTTIDLPASVMKNVYKVIGRFSSAASDIPIAFLEGVAAEKRVVTETRVKLIRENADQIAKRLNVPEIYVRRAGNKYAEKIIGEQINLDNISAFTIEELQKPKTEKSNTQDNNNSNIDNLDVTTAQNTDNSEEKTIGDDWLNRFETEARQISSEEMQRRFARVLAGEIQKPGSFSIKAIKILSELDKNTAALFRQLCSVCVIFGILHGDSDDLHTIVDARVPSLGGVPSQNALDKYGLGFDQLNILNEAMLIISEYKSQFSSTHCVVNFNKSGTWALKHQEKYWKLLPGPDWNTESEFSLEGIAFSRLGRELLQVVDTDPMPEYTEDLKIYFAKQHLQMVEVPSPIPKDIKK
ncbi:MAG: DUF2806 domain-containing protein [Candidatus Poribacteria bacterium]|nr:DUF2806 domain-containing protein [Candidatus Poribacteria bacterium]